jgi:hypothetical protein
MKFVKTDNRTFETEDGAYAVYRYANNSYALQTRLTYIVYEGKTAVTDELGDLVTFKSITDAKQFVINRVMEVAQ